MVGGGEDPQKLKRMAAAAYDYGNDPRWADYWSNVLIPPQMASRDDVVTHFKRKFYQRYIDPLRGGKEELFDDLVALIHADDEEALS